MRHLGDDNMNWLFKSKLTIVFMMVALVLMTGCAENPNYTISFESNGGSLIESITITDENNFNLPDDPLKEGYTFDNWYLDSQFSELFFYHQLTSNIIVYAKWIPNTYTITYESNGGSSITPTNHLFESTVIEPETPIKTGYSFKGWFSDINLKEAYSFSKMPSHSFTLYAKWTINQYTISFDSNGGSLVNPITQTFEGRILEPTPPTKDDYLFLGWFSDIELENEFNFTIMPASDITLYAKWDEDPKGLIYQETEEGLEVTGYNGTDPNIVIPSMFKSMIVVGIADNAFSKRSDIQSITIPSTVTYIGANAFKNLTSLTTISFEPQSKLQSIGDYAFDSAKLLTSIIIPSSVEVMGIGAFMNTDSLTTVTFESNSKLTVISQETFSNAISLRTIELPEGITLIGKDAFSYTNSLETVNIPSTVKTIAARAFYEAGALTTITIAENSQLESIGNYAFLNAAELKSIYIPITVTEMGYRIFYFCKSLTIYVAAKSLPTTWDVDWNTSNGSVVWGYIQS